MRFNIVRDNGDTVNIDPMNTTAAADLVDILSEKEIAVLGVAMLLVREHVTEAAKLLVERQVKENPMEMLKKMLGSGPTMRTTDTRHEGWACTCSECTAQREALDAAQNSVNDKLGEVDGTTGMYL